MKSFFLVALSLLLGVSFLAASPTNPKGPAKITKNEAEHIALKQHEGARVTAAKLEKVEGVLVWSIDIGQRNGNEITRVAVDAKSGRIIPGKGVGAR
ncbi:MAG: PepSY domain-containing protein [Chthoniobacterales bacterium]